MVSVGGGVIVNVGINVCVGELTVDVSAEGTPIAVLLAIGVGGTAETPVDESVHDAIVAVRRMNRYPFFIPRFYYCSSFPGFCSISITSQNWMVRCKNPTYKRGTDLV